MATKVRVRKSKKMTFNDLKDGMDAAKFYGFDQRETERQIRSHLKDQGREELRSSYESFYRKRK